MRKYLLILLGLLFLINNSNAQYVSIPDSNFGKWLSNNGYSNCLIGNSTTGWLLDTSCNAVVSTTNINCSTSLSNTIINDLTGIQYFTALDSLDCSGNELSYLPTITNSLSYLNCSYNVLNSLPSLPASLVYLYCANNNLNSLPVLPSALHYLNFSYNSISALPSLPSSLEGLYCDHNNLSSLPALPASLLGLHAGSNHLSSLPTLPASLDLLDCSQNQITLLPTLPNSMEGLYCYSNHLTSLPDLPNSLYDLNCRDNNNLTCLPYIKRSLLYNFGISGTQIHCLPNRFTAQQYDVLPDTLPLCDPASGCPFYYNLAGYIHQDSSVSCLDDSLNLGTPLQNIKVLLSHNGILQQQVYSDYTTDNYSFKIDSLTQYEISIDTAGLPFFVACPSSQFRSVLLNSVDSVRLKQNFALTCTNPDYGILYIASPYAHPFRRGILTPINISAGNINNLRYGANCKSGMSGIVITTYSGTIHYSSPAPGAYSPTTVSGNTLTYDISNLDSIIAGGFDIIFSTDSNSIVGSSICIRSVVSLASADENPFDDTLIQCFTVHDSHDPNLKEVFPTTFSENSDWLTYTIHFQNTGNDTAYTVRIKDTLSSNLIPETFQYIASSHRAVTQILGNTIVFTFPKINLVDSAANAALSEGWIQYRVKNKPNLAPSSTIENTAYIYFDNNPAVITNTAVVNVLEQPNSVIGEFKGIEFNVYPNPLKGISLFCISSSMAGQISFSNSLGQSLYTTEIREGNNYIHTEQLNNIPDVLLYKAVLQNGETKKGKVILLTE